jgi:hypothetical protein
VCRTLCPVPPHSDLSNSLFSLSNYTVHYKRDAEYADSSLRLSKFTPNYYYDLKEKEMGRVTDGPNERWAE